MPRSSEGHINAGRVDRSPRLMRIIEILKEAEHPLSAQEIAIRAYDFGASGKIMLNVSTNIGEIRAPVNYEAGYIVSPAKVFRQDPGRTPYAWHDSRPRYFLIAAPGWYPRWTVTEEGELRYLSRSTPGDDQIDLGI